jgi:hypothetical protein
MKVSTLKVRILYGIIIVLFFFTCISEAAPRKTTRKKKKDISDSRMTGVYYCIAILSLTFIPSLVLFFYSLYKDPMTPTIISRLLEVAKDRTIGYLSRKKTT